MSLGHERRALMKGMCALTKGTPRRSLTLFLPCEVIRKREPSVTCGGPSPRCSNAGTLIMEFHDSASKTMRYYFF